MNTCKSALPAETAREVSALIETLHRTGQRLEELTAGEVDTVADREGRTFLLQRAQEHLRQNEAAKQAAILNALPAHIALLDNDGVILAVNEAWRRFTGANARQGARDGVGVNYLETCDIARGPDSAEARQVAEGIRAVLDGSLKKYSIEYPCHSPMEQRWFLLIVTPLAEDHLNGAVVMHLNISERKRAEIQLRRLAGAMDATVDAIYLVDRASMRFVHVNDAACRMLKKTREELLALGPAGVLSIPGVELKRTYDDIIASGEPPAPLEMLRHREDGSQVWIELRRQAQHSADGWLIVTMVRDITARKRVSDELLESDRRFADMMGNVDLMSIVIDPQSRIIYCNDYFLALTGWRREELLGENFVDLIIPANLVDEVREVHSGMIADLPAARHHVNEILTRSGERRLIRWNNSVLRSPSGEVIGTASIGEDVTERTRVEEALKVSEREQRQLVEELERERARLVAAQRVAKIGSWETDVATLSVIWSDETHRIFETDPVTFHPTHEHFLEYVHPADRIAVDEAFSQSLREHAAYHSIEHRLQLPDGRIKFVEERWRVFFDQQDKPVRAVGTCQDITERNEVAQEFRESERRFSDLLRNVELASVMLDCEGRITFCNEYLLRLTGWQYEKVIGKNWFEVFKRKPARDGQEFFAMLRANQHGVLVRENEIFTRFGEPRLMRWNNALLRSGTGEIIGSASIGEDVTARKHAEDEVRRLNANLERTVAERTAALEAANRELEAFDYSVSHDLRAPIRHIEGFSTMLMEEYGDRLDERGRDFLQRTQNAAHRMEELVGDLLALSLVSRGELNREEIDLSALALRVFADLQKTEPGRVIGCVVTPGLTANADRGLLRIVLENLIGNARKFSAGRSGAKIEVGSAATERGIAFFVRDNGAGFDAVYADRLFAPFQRLHAQSEFKGTGIGLATVSRIITRHGGRVWAEGVVDEGATFHFTLSS